MTTPTPKLPTVVLNVEDLQHYHLNPRRGDVDVIAESLEELDQYRTIVVNKGTHTGRPNEVLAGNHTLKAALRLGWTTIEATVIDVDDVKAAKIVAVDNRSNDLATYDDTALAQFLEEAIGYENLAGTGFTEDDYDMLVGDLDLPDPLDTGGTGVGTGELATSESLVWGFVQWSTTRVRITADEVRVLDAQYEAYVDEFGNAQGFGHWLAGKAQEAALLRAAGPAEDAEVTA